MKHDRPKDDKIIDVTCDVKGRTFAFASVVFSAKTTLRRSAHLYRVAPHLRWQTSLGVGRPSGLKPQSAWPRPSRQTVAYGRENGVVCCVHLSDSIITRLQARASRARISGSDDITVDGRIDGRRGAHSRGKAPHTLWPMTLRHSKVRTMTELRFGSISTDLISISMFFERSIWWSTNGRSPSSRLRHPHRAARQSRSLRQHCVYGILAKATHEELERLYIEHSKGILGETYLPEAVLVETSSGLARAICYICPRWWQDAGAGLRATNHRPCAPIRCFRNVHRTPRELHALTQRDTSADAQEAGGRAKSLRSSVGTRPARIPGPTRPARDSRHVHPIAPVSRAMLEADTQNHTLRPRRWQCRNGEGRDDATHGARRYQSIMHPSPVHRVRVARAQRHRQGHRFPAATPGSTRA